MKRTIQLFFAVILLAGVTAKAWSQKIGYISENSYKTSLGLRAGSETGFTFKHFYKPTWAFEGTITTGGYRALVATALFEKHFPVDDTEGLNWFFGGGAHIAHWGRVTYYNNRYTNGEKYYYPAYEKTPSAGVDGVFGIEYKFPEVPFTIGADVKPFYDFFHPLDSWAEGAFSLRYVLK